MKKIYWTLFLLIIFHCSGFSQTLDYSFVVVGCNRVDAADTIGNPSTANLYHLNRMFLEISQMNPLPEYLFMAGDVVLGYDPDTIVLAKELRAWKQVFLSSPLAGTSVKLVVIPGNHETQNKVAGKITFPAAERTFLREMANYIVNNNGPKATGLLPGTDSLVTDQSQLTYSFNYGKDHFVMVDTDPYGRDSRVAYHWIGQDVAKARAAGARHIFTIGHKPAYPSPFTPTDGLVTYKSERDSYWAVLEDSRCEAMFSAHNHLWDKVQPHAGKTWQIIAGNGGSSIDWPTSYATPYYGYTVVNIFTNGKVVAKSMGRDIGAHYTDPVPASPTTVRDSVELTWPAPKLIHYWNFNNVTGTVASVNADFSAIGKGVVTYGKMPGVTANYVGGYMDNVTPGDTINAKMLAPAGNGIRPRNPSDSMQFLVYMPTSGYQNIVVSFETQKSSATNGAAYQSFDYSLDSGKTFLNTGPYLMVDTTSTLWKGVRIDLSGITGLNNNSKAVFRIRFSGTTTGTSGNNRIDNFAVEGDTSLISVTPTCTPATVASQPASPSWVYANGGTVTFTASANGSSPITYQWMENGLPLTDGGIYAGSSTTSLTITNPPVALNGKKYSLKITNCSGQNTATSNTATLTVKEPSPRGTLIHYWNFNSVSGTVTSVDADYSATGKGVAVYEEIPGTTPAYSPGYMDNIAPGDTINARMDAVGIAGSGIRPRNPSDSMEFVFYIPTTKFENIRIKFETEKSTNGPSRQTYDYSPDSGKTFLQDGMPVTFDSAGLVWSLVDLDLSNVPVLNDNGKVLFRIRYTAGNITATNGNNRFDNVTVEGDPVNVTANTPAAEANNMNVYPNPFVNQATLIVNSAYSQNINIRITDVRGTLMQSYEKLPSSAGFVFGDELPAGVYYVHVSAGANAQTLKVVKMK